MLSLLLLWTLLLLPCFCIGTLIVEPALAHLQIREGDRCLMSLWLGLGILCSFLLFLALFFPLSPLILPAVTGVALTACFFSRNMRNAFNRFREAMSFDSALLWISLALICAAVSLQPVSNRDAISYHFDLITIMSRAGIVPGLGLVHERYGFVSSWFTVPAMFNHGTFAARISTAGNGFALLLATGNIAVSGRRILNGTGRRSDFFGFSAFVTAMAFPLMLCYSLSATPDFIILVLVCVTAWVVLTTTEKLHRRTDGASGPLADGDILAVLLASCAFGMKTTAGPLLLAAFVYYVWRKRFRVSSIFTALAAVALLSAPYLLASTLASGFPLYPLPWAIDLPWTVSDSTARGAYLPVFEWSKYANYNGLRYLSPSWLLPWLAVRKENVAAFALIVLSVIYMAWALVSRRKSLQGLWFPLVCGFGGLLFVIAMSPQPRFAWGYVALIPSALAVIHHDGMRRTIDRTGFGRLSSVATALPLVAVVLLTVPTTFLYSTTSEKRLDAAVKAGIVSAPDAYNLLLPPVIPSVRYDDEKDLAIPHTGHTLAGEPVSDGRRGMFYSMKPEGNVCYRNVAKGYRGGFRRCMENSSRDEPQLR